jgi:hypothetical protein
MDKLLTPLTLDQLISPIPTAHDTAIMPNPIIQAVPSKRDLKLAALSVAKEAKVDALQEKPIYKTAILESMTDADSPQFLGVTGGVGAGGALIGVATEDRIQGFDAYEVPHPDNVKNDEYLNTPSGKLKIERQKARLAQELNRPIKSITMDDIYRAGTKEQLLGLYNLTKDANTSSWTPGPLDWVDKDHGLHLGDKKNPLNIPVERVDTGEVGHFGRPLTNVRNPSTQQSIGNSLGYREPEYVGLMDVDTNRAFTSNRNKVGNAVEAAASTIVKSVYGTADAVSELAGWLSEGKVGGSIASSKEIEEYANKLTGYDASHMQNASEEIKTAYGKFQKDGDWGEFLFTAGPSALEVAGEAGASSLAFVATLFLPGKPLQAASKLGKLIKAETAGMNAVDKASKTKELVDGAKTVDKLMRVAQGQTGFIANSMGQTSANMEEYKALYKEDMSPIRVMGSFGINMLVNNLDGFIDKGIITKAGIGSESVMKLLNMASDKDKLVLAKTLTAKGFGVAADIIIKEIPTEVIQASMENVSKVYKEDGLGITDIVTSQKNQEDMIVSAMMTPGSVGVMKAAGVAYVPVAAGIEGITNSKSETINEKPVKLTEAQIKSAETVDKLKKFVNTNEPKGYAAVLKKLDILDMSKDTEIEAQKLRQTIADKLSQTDVPIKLEELRLGSSEEAEAFIEEMFVNATDRNSTSLMNNLLKIGERFGVGFETVKLIKDSATVEFEATAGKKGYQTYDRALKRLNTDPEGNSKTISQIEDQLEHFENTQIDRLDRFEKKVSTIEANLKSGIQKDGKERVSYAGGGGFDIYIKEGKIIPATYNTIKAIKRNVEGIGKVIDKYGIQRTEPTGIDPYSPTGKFRVDKKVTPKNRLGFLSKLESKIKKGETIFMDIASKRTKTEHITANKLAKNGYVEVDVAGHPQPKSGRWVSKINIKVDEIKVEAKRQKLEKKTESMEVTKIVTRLQRKELLTPEEEAFKAEHEAQVKQELQQVDVIAKIQQIDNNVDVYTEELKELEKDAESNGTEILKLSNMIEELEARKEKIISKDITRDLLRNSVSNTIKEADKGYAGAKFAQPTEISKYVKLSNSVSSLLGSVHVKYFSSAVVQDAQRLTTNLLKKILAPIDNEVTKYKVPKELLQLMSSPSRGLIFDTEGSINENVAVAIDVALTEYMAMGAYNLGSKNKEQIAAMTGKQEFDIDKDMIKFFKDLGMYSKNAVDDIGKTILQSLGLSMNENIPQDLYAKLVADLGNVALHVGIKNGDLEFIDVKAAKHNKFLGYIIDEKTVETTIPFIRFTAKGKVNMPIHKATFDEFKKVLKVEDTFKKGPHFKPIKTKDRSIRNNPITEQSDTAAKVLDLFRQDKFVKEEGVFTWLVENKNRDIVLHRLGYMTEKEMQELSYNARDSQKAKNEEIIRSLDALKELEMDEMYFDWFYSKNGRYMMDSNTVNPQTDKLHRFTVVMEAHRSELDVNNNEHMELFRFALAQAFGMSTDKKSNAEVQEFGKLLLKKDPKELMQMLETGKFTDGIEVEHLSHYLQGVEALKVYNAAKDGKFDTFLTVESDAVTSGFGLKLLQFPILKDKEGIKSVFETVKDWLAKTGMFIDKTVTSMNDEISTIDVVTGKKVFFDSYETLAKTVHHGEVREENYPKKEGKDWNPWDGVVKYDSSIPHEVFVAALPTVDDEGKVGKALRTLFKDPFMTFNYSRGIGAIKKSLGSIIADGLIDKFVAGKDLSKEENALLLKLKLTYGKSLISDLKKKDPSTITAISPGMSDLYKYLNDMGVSTYGHLAAKSLEDNFSEFVKVNDITNKAFTEMFIAYDTDYLIAVSEVQNSKGRGITKKEDLEIIKSLRDKFPLIKGPYSKAENLSDTIAIYDTVNIDSKTLEESYGTVSTKLADGKNKKVQSKIRQLKAAIKSGSVVPIHYLDGAAIGNTILDFNGGILGIHDAIITKLLKTKEVVSSYNKNIVKVNKEYSIIEALLESYTRVFKDASTEESEKTLTELKEVAEFITKMRKELFNHDIDVVHMSAMPGSKYAYKGENIKVESKYNDAQKKAILEILNKPVVKQLLLRNNIQLEEC